MVMVGKGECRGKQCNNYRCRAQVMRSNDSGYMPVFGLPPDEFCAHEAIYKPPKGMLRPIDYPCGIKLEAIKICPNG